jgi:hypothetical protein
MSRATPRDLERRCSRWLAICLAMSTAGCGQSGIDAALEADARGYLCSACTNRFRTDASVFADRCPRCGTLELLEVVGYVCPADGTMILGPRGKSGVTCFKCGRSTEGIRLPSSGDLDAWGAPRQSRDDVSRTTNPE